MKRVAVHQPNYFPWIGYFAKIARVDVFVLLDDVDFQSGNATSVTNRTQIKTRSGPLRLTVPVARKGSRLLRDVEVDYGRKWARKHLDTLRFAYAKSVHVDPVTTLVQDVLGRAPARLAELNLDGIAALCRLLSIETRLVVSSTLALRSTEKNERILEICEKVGAGAYVSGAGARRYNDPDAFAAKGIALEYLDFQCPEYPQLHGEFVPNLSMLDALFNVGGEARRLLA